MGYIGYSMSERARDAYLNDEMPLSSWRKGDIIYKIGENISIAAAEYCIDREKHNPVNCPEFAESGIISAENGNIFPFYGTQWLFSVLICCHALRLHSLRANLAACLYMHLSAYFQIAKWKDKSFFDTS